MKKFSLIMTCFVINALVSSLFLFSENAQDTPNCNSINKSRELPDEVVVQFVQNTKNDDIVSLMQRMRLIKKKESYKPGKFTVFKNADSLRSIGALIWKLRKEPCVSKAERNYIAYKATTPNDPFYQPYQWNMKRICVERAWNISTGSGIIIAVLDTGVKQSLEDFCVTNFAGGYNFIDNKTDSTDDEGHGSHICGTIAQSTNNHLGVVGVAYNCTIMPVKVLDQDGCGSYTQIADGIYWAVDHGAHVLNMSFSGSYDQVFLEEAIRYAYDRGVVLVCAAGNSKSEFPEYPAAYSYCISVSATAGNDRLASYSSFGPSIDICAPGGDNGDYNGDGEEDMIFQETFTDSGDGYYPFAGTSMAAAHVSGVAALILSVNPGLNGREVKEIFEMTAEDLGAPGKDKYYGFGMVNAYSAVKEAQKRVKTNLNMYEEWKKRRLFLFICPTQ